MDYAIRILKKEKYILDNVLKSWPSVHKTKHSAVWRDRNRRLKSIEEAIELLENQK